MASYALYFAIKYSVNLSKSINAEMAIESNDCILLAISDIYFKKYNETQEIDKLKIFARSLKGGDFDEFWLFAYEALSVGFLSGEWRKLKQNNISFIKIIRLTL